MEQRTCGRRIAEWMLILCLLLCSLTLSAAAVTQQVAVVAYKEVYMDGEQLQMQARLVPPQNGVAWAWECRKPGEEAASVICTSDKILLDLTLAYHGAVLCPVATLADGTVVRGPEKILTVELYCTGLELSNLPAKCAYAPGEDFDPSGVQIMAKISDGSLRDVTHECSYTPMALDLGTEQVAATCALRRENGEMGLFSCQIPVTVTVPDAPGDGTGQESDVGEKPGDGGEDSNQIGGDAGAGVDDGEIVIIPEAGSQNPGGSTGGTPQKPSDQPSGEGNSGGNADPDTSLDGSTDDPVGDGGSDTDLGTDDADGTQDGSTEDPEEDIRAESPRWSENRGSGVMIGICILGVLTLAAAVLWKLLRNRQ